MDFEYTVLRIEDYYRFHPKHALTHSWYSIDSTGKMIGKRPDVRAWSSASSAKKLLADCVATSHLGNCDKVIVGDGDKQDFTTLEMV